MRPAITIRGKDRLITNTDKAGNVMGGPRWHVKIGKRARQFTQAIWERDGLSWMAESLAALNPAHGKNPRKSKISEEQE